MEGHQVDILRDSGDDGAADDIGVAVEELGVGSDDEVCPEIQRLLQDWRAEGVVDGHDSALALRGMSQLSRGSDVGDAQQWVGRGLHQE